MFVLKYTKKGFVFSNLLSRVITFIQVARVVYVLRFRNMTLFPVRENSECRCSLEFVVHCGIFQGANIPVHWKDFAIETALKWPTPWSVPWLLNKGADWDAPMNGETSNFPQLVTKLIDYISYLKSPMNSDNNCLINVVYFAQIALFYSLW